MPSGPTASESLEDTCQMHRCLGLILTCWIKISRVAGKGGVSGVYNFNKLFWCTDSSWNHCIQLQALIVYISDIYDMIYKILNYIPLNLYPTLTRGKMKGRLLFNSHQNNFLFFPQFWQHMIPYVSFLFLWTLLYLHIIILSKTDFFC